MASRKPVTPVAIGDLKTLIAIQSLALTSDGQGGQVESWSTLGTEWAYVRPTRASERLYSQQIQYQRTHEIIIRHRTDITFDMRVTYDNRTLQVKGVRNYDSRNSFLILDCEENQGN